MFKCESQYNESDENNEEGIIIAHSDGEIITREFYESSTGVPVNLDDVFVCMCDDFQEQLTVLPERFSVKEFLESQIDVPNDDQYSESIKSAAAYGIDHLDLFNLLARIIWIRLFMLFESYISENGKSVHMTNCNFTYATAKMHQLFHTNEYRSDLISAFSVNSWSELDDGQRTLGSQLVFHLFQLFANELGNMVCKEEARPILFDVRNMGPDGNGKIRYIGGWAICKALRKSQR